MADDVDEFLASLDAFSSPTIDAGISHVRYSPDDPMPAASPQHSGRRNQQRKRSRAAHLHSNEAQASDHHPSSSSRVHRGAGGAQQSDGATVKEPYGGIDGDKRRLAQQTASPLEKAVQPARWTCLHCTLINSAHLPVCAVCEQPRPVAAASPAVSATALEQTWDCPRCTFINRSTQPQCAMCDGCRPLGNQGDSSSSSLPSLSLPCLDGNRVATAAPTTGGFAVASSGACRTPLVAAGRRGGDDCTEREIGGDSNAASHEVGDADGSDEGSSSVGSDSDSAAEASGSDDGNADGNALNNVELVRFLQTLESVPCDQLPCAPVPPTMVATAQLRGFQLQALHWLLSREGRVPCRRGRPPDDRHHHRHDAHDRSDREGCTTCASPPVVTVTDSDEEGETSNEEDSRPEVSQHSMLSVRGGIYADYMGLGKTRTLIALCEATRGPRYDRVTGSHVASPATLVVCPTSLLAQWRAEIERCVSPAPRVLLYYGSRKKRVSVFSLAQDYDYVLTSYQSLRHEMISRSAAVDKMSLVCWNRIILDEAHYLRNPRTQQSRACMRLSGSYRWTVTATPVQNSLNDIFPLLQFLKVPHFGVPAWWNQEIVRYLNEDVHHPRPVTALRLLFASLLLRRTPDSIVDGKPILSLPKKTCTTRLVQLSAPERTFYDRVHSNATAKLNSATSGRSAPLLKFSTAFEMLMRCRQSCLHPYIVVAALRRCKSTPPTHAPATTSAETEDAKQAVVSQFVDHVLRRRLKTHAASFVQELTDVLRRQELQKHECVICMETLNRPAILPCAHTFCLECIHHALGMTLKCPLCKSPTKRAQVLEVPTEVLGGSAAPEASAGSAVPFAEADVSSVERWTLTSAKTAALLEAIATIPRHEKIIVFSSFLTYLTYLRCRLQQVGVSCAMFSGSLTLHEKEKVLRSFQSTASSTDAGDNGSASPRVLLATITTCGVGLNLTFANHCFVMDPTWNPGVEEQAVNRIYRIGQTREVHITKLIARGTVEEKIEALCQRKQSLSGYCFNAQSASGGDGRLRAEDLLALFADESSSDSSASSSESDND